MAKRAERTRNGGKWTEAQYWSAVRSALRSKFRWWQPAAVAVNRASRPYVGKDPRRKKEVQCAACSEWFPPSLIEKDHVVACGSLKCAADLAGFLERLTPENPDAFQPLCKPCHKARTKEQRKKKT